MALNGGCDTAGGDKGTTQIITAMANKGIGTFVIGFGKGVDAKQLNIFAAAGGVPKKDPQDPNKFYKADDAKSLQAALTAIGGSIVGCSFKLKSVPPDPNKLYVFFDDKTVAKDPTNGWTYDAKTNTLTFNGNSCQQLKSNQVKDVDVVFGCNTPVPS